MRTLACIAALAAAPAFADTAITIPLVAEFGGKPFDCQAQYTGIGTSGSTVEIADFRLFISNVRLIGAHGAEVPLVLTPDNIWQTDRVALLDFENATGTCANGTPQVNTTLRGTAPEGSYTGLTFDIGVPFDLNHGDPTLAASPLNVTAMFWTWQSGYKFLKLDMATAGLPLAPMAKDTTTPTITAKMDDMMKGPNGWSLHLGSTGCASASETTGPAAECANPNRIAVALAGFAPGKSVMVIDPAALLAGSDVDINTPDTAPGCMSGGDDPDCADVMARLGLPFGGAAGGPQTLVSLR